MDGAALVRAEIADLSRGDLDAVMSYYTDNVYFEDVSMPEPYVGKKAMRELMAGIYTGFPDLHIEIRHVVASGTVVAAEYDLLGTHTGRSWATKAPAAHSASPRSRSTSTTHRCSPERPSITTPPLCSVSSA